MGVISLPLPEPLDMNVAKIPLFRGVLLSMAREITSNQEASSTGASLESSYHIQFQSPCLIFSPYRHLSLDEPTVKRTVMSFMLYQHLQIQVGGLGLLKIERKSSNLPAVGML